MNLEKHNPETLTELLERIKTLHINEGLGRKRDEITRLLDQCLEMADFEPYKGVNIGDPWICIDNWYVQAADLIDYPKGEPIVRDYWGWIDKTRKT